MAAADDTGGDLQSTRGAGPAAERGVSGWPTGGSAANIDDSELLKALQTPPETKAAMQQAAGMQQELARSILSTPAPNLPTPQVHNIPPPPAPPPPQDPIKAFGSIASIFGIFASAFTRAPLTSALNAAAGAMNALKAGDIQRYQQNYQAWKTNAEYVSAQARSEAEMTKAILDRADWDINKKLAASRVLAAERGDLTALELSRHGDLQLLVSHNDAKMRAGEKVNGTIVQLEKAATQQYDKIEAKAEADLNKITPNIDHAQEALNDALSILDKAKTETAVGVTGLRGVVQSWWDYLKGDASLADRFRADIKIIQDSYRDIMHTTGYRGSVAQNQRLDAIVEGLGPHSNIEGAKQSLGRIQELIGLTRTDSQRAYDGAIKRAKEILKPEHWGVKSQGAGGEGGGGGAEGGVSGLKEGSPGSYTNPVKIAGSKVEGIKQYNDLPRGGWFVDSHGELAQKTSDKKIPMPEGTASAAAAGAAPAETTAATAPTTAAPSSEAPTKLAEGEYASPQEMKEREAKKSAEADAVPGLSATGRDPNKKWDTAKEDGTLARPLRIVSVQQRNIIPDGYFYARKDGSVWKKKAGGVENDEKHDDRPTARH